MQNIKFIGAPKHLLNEGALSSVLVHYASCEGYTIGALEYNFIDSEKMYSLNKQHLNHLTDTDIITFDYSEEKAITAEVFISKEMMVINADTYSQTIEREAVRLISHALFHCLGYKDKSSKEKDIMRRKEEDFIFSVSRETKQDV
ncbi:MAG: rRNA maturation RNase YbeY [Cryomorphaceae bacterium]|jgi:rRNA maturation RNase YbeY|nr:rRNA maturation RNase YbeY [Cryomorphaceae bacterium]MDG1889315.1 rRNA maturation RNase YbeY [Flavobacteriaceae bacterium]MBT3689521.1 rRNA maturation RNase YbeY [Cryomorphaceae bacterium]MBT4221837.1 rRNA maturation RNase YbeY [Cryomorphaceae bacterium]MBT4293429.1 rRNA maturation RNase YbeY [Cryomorphaceae bacterium]|tara:strand:+ start:1423 stop:1857 length:435 start_codon:yes stop_codon:yes gene_type:complete